MSNEVVKTADAELDACVLHLEDAGASPSFFEKLLKYAKVWNCQLYFGGNLTSHLWFWAGVVAERVAKRFATLRRTKCCGECAAED